MFNIYPLTRVLKECKMISATDSEVIDLRGGTLVGIIFPTGWISSNVTFKAHLGVDPDGSVAGFTVKDAAGTSVTITTGAAGEARYFGADVFRAFQFLSLITAADNSNKKVLLIVAGLAEGK